MGKPGPGKLQLGSQQACRRVPFVLLREEDQARRKEHRNGVCELLQKAEANMSKLHTLHSVHAHLSPAQAAQAVEVSRWTIMRAIKANELKAVRDNRNHWRIEPDELDKWRLHTVRTVEFAHPVHTLSDTPETLVKVAALEAENSQLRERLLDVQEDRNAWKQQATALLSAPQKKRNWWPW